MRNYSPFNSLVEIKLLFLDEVDIEEQAESDGLKLVSKEDFRCFAALTLDFLHEDTPRYKELKVSQSPEVFLKMMLDEGESKFFLNPKISLVKLDDEKLYLKYDK